MKHLMTKLTSGLLILTLVVGFLLNIMPAAMADDDAHTHGGQVFMPWNSTNSLPTQEGNYYLTDDVNLGVAWYDLPQGTIRLCLNGHSITGNINNPSIIVDAGRTLELYDENNNGTITHGSNWTGPGVYIYGGTFIMHGGKICNNISQSKGGGVDINHGGTFKMTGGKITGNTAVFGGGVFCGNNDIYQNEGHCLFEMSGTAVITGNIATGSGGGVCTENDAGMTMSGGSITGNTANVHGGGVCVEGYSSMTMTGGSISQNEGLCYGGGIYVFDNASLTISGGSITGNNTNGTKYLGKIISGGGVCAVTPQNGYFRKLSGSPVIQGNTIGNKKDDFYLNDGCVLTLTGKLTDAASIGITMRNETGLFTQDWKTIMGDADPAKYFFSNNDSYMVAPDQGEAVLAEPRTVTFEANGGSGRMDKQKVPKSISAVLSANAFTAPDGYVFDKWNTKKDGSGEEYPDKATIVLEEDRTLYAQWKAIPAKQAQITKQPKDLTLTYGYTEGSLSVDAEAAEDGKYQLSYQWYSCENTKKKNAKEIKGATKASYIIPAGKNAGAECYYCTVAATRKDNKETATVDSDVATVTVEKANAAIQTVPTANNRTYDGTEKPLLNSDGKAEGGTLVYAKGTEATTAPAKNQYTEAIPMAIDAGTYYAWVFVQGDENHKDTDAIYVTVTINAPDPGPEPEPQPQKTDIGKAKLNYKTSFVYNGKAQKPTTTVTLNGKKLVPNADYTATYANNKDIGTATITITGIGDYTGSKAGVFTIVPAAVKLNKLEPGKKKATLDVSWKKGVKNDGYEVEYSQKKNFKDAKKIKVKGAKKLKCTIKKLKKGKTYYVRVRTYKKVKGKMYYSAWSKVESKKIGK